MTVFTSLSAVTDNADGDAINVDVKKVHATVGYAAKSSDFGSGTVKLQAMLPDESTWFDVPSATRTATGYGVATNVVATKLRLVLSGATAPAALTGYIVVDDGAAETTVTAS